MCRQPDSQVAEGLEEEPDRRHQEKLVRPSDDARHGELQAWEHGCVREAEEDGLLVAEEHHRRAPELPPLKKPANGQGKTGT